jgi:hypothetical protein
MVVNFMAREISRDTCKLTRTPTLIIIIIKNNLSNFKLNDSTCNQEQVKWLNDL